MRKVAAKAGASSKRAAKASPSVRTVTVKAQLAAFLAKFDPKVAALIRSCRRELRRQLPTANELVYDNYNFFVIGYASTDRASDCIVSLAAAANGVGLSFYYGAKLKDPARLLQGTGNQNRYIRLPQAGVLKDPAVASLISAAAENGKTQLPRSGRGDTIIKSVSEKQRPRRNEAHAV
jgi:hypothetical protein